ncbi:hypothetical protein ACFC06_01505 [Nocardia sp. NPDC056064]|uniref:hypothetical protein n=1 Tax=Nocardia sp. NPDC056064 TaxID=3345701 RepID=UPI0035E2A626
MGDRSRFEEWEARLWERLARLLPAAQDAESFRDSREIGEQEAGLWFLLERLADLAVPVDEATLAEIEVLAEHWGERLSVHHRVDACAKDPDRAATVRLVPDSEVRSAVEDGTTVLPWIECARCPSVLARAHAREASGRPSQYAVRYLVSRADAPEPEVFAPTELLRAFESVLGCH